MKHKSKSNLGKFICTFIFSFLFIFATTLSGYAHTVNSYSTNCAAGPQYSVTANMSNNNSSSNYRWQWKNNSGSWICFVNGNNTINANTYNVSGAVVNSANLTTETITFTDPNAGLQGLEMRMVISDGTGVDPCTLPANNTWTSTTNNFININGTPCGTSTSDCACTNSAANLLTNASFENGNTGWSVTGGTITTGTGYIICGAANGFLNWSSGTAMTWQQVAAIAGNTYNASAYLGTHAPGISCSPKFQLAFLNAAGTLLNRISVTVTTNVDVSPNKPTLYTLSAVAPTGTANVRVEATITCNTMKMDAFCLTHTAPCTGKVTGLYFNKLDGGTDLPITNGSIFTTSQLGSLYNLETSNTGTVGSVVYNIIGPSSTSNIENVSPYNSPGTGSGAWTGQVGSYSVNLKTYSGTDGSGTLCHDTTITFVLAASTNPDFNSTFVNLAVPGNVNTNDQVPAGSTYGTSPTLLSSPSGSVATITMNSNGTYSFTANTIGVYTYDVPVCVPGQTAPCPPTKLVITVLNANSTSNAPVANADVATTNLNTAVTLRTLANDAAGNANTSLVPSSVTVTSAPKRGTAIVNATTGDITYTPNAGFSGRDTLTYQVCDNQTPAKCATAVQIITVNPAGTPNSTAAADDYKITSINTAATGNVKTNDTDAEGNMQTVTAQTTTVSGKGTLVLNTNGSYTFTPVTGFTGPVDFVYTTCDNGTPQACATATLHILVKPIGDSPDLTPRINLNPNNIIGTSSLEITVQVNEIKNVSTNGSTITLFVDKQNFFSNFTFNSAQTTNLAGQPIQNNLFSIDAVSNPDFYVITTNAVFANSLRRVTFSVTVNPGQTKGTTPLNVFLQNGSGGETNFTNNSSFTILTFSF